MTVLTKNLFTRSFFIGCFFAIAGHYLLLNAQFLAIVHIIVYAGCYYGMFLFYINVDESNEETEQPQPALAK